ncbi:hypothetical protein MMPV_000491 [Pyropia vietnamensis]
MAGRNRGGVSPFPSSWAAVTAALASGADPLSLLPAVAAVTASPPPPSTPPPRGDGDGGDGRGGQPPPLHLRAIPPVAVVEALLSPPSSQVLYLDTAADVDILATLPPPPPLPSPQPGTTSLPPAAVASAGAGTDTTVGVGEGSRQAAAVHATAVDRLAALAAELAPLAAPTSALTGDGDRDDHVDDDGDGGRIRPVLSAATVAAVRRLSPPDWAWVLAAVLVPSGGSPAAAARLAIGVGVADVADALLVGWLGLIDDGSGGPAADALFTLLWDQCSVRRLPPAAFAAWVATAMGRSMATAVTAATGATAVAVEVVTVAARVSPIHAQPLASRIPVAARGIVPMVVSTRAGNGGGGRRV